MGKLKNNQKGFGAIEWLLIIVIIGLIGFVGWYVYKSMKNTNNAYSSASKVASSSVSNPYADWGTYTDTSGWFTLKYPTDWTDNTVKAGAIVSEGPSQTPTKLTANSQGELVPSVLKSIGVLMSVENDTYTGTVQSYLSPQESKTTQNKDLTINGYQAHYSLGVNNGGFTDRTYQIFYKGKVAILNSTLTTPEAFDGTPGTNYSKYTSVEDQIAKSIHFKQ